MRIKMKIKKSVKQLEEPKLRIIYCRNGAKIYVTSVKDNMCFMDKNRVCRLIHCFISESEGVKIIPEISQYYLGNEVSVHNECNYIIPEKIMGKLIYFNDGLLYQLFSKHGV